MKIYPLIFTEDEVLNAELIFGTTFTRTTTVYQAGLLVSHIDAEVFRLKKKVTSRQ